MLATIPLLLNTVLSKGFKIQREDSSYKLYGILYGSKIKPSVNV